jgi:predicted ribosome quality control (RQC) complex YloA/Tae2 family protein
VPEASLREAASLAAWFSAARDAKGVAVAVTDVRHVRRLKGGGPGMVRFEHESTLMVDPLPPGDIGDPADV